LFTDFTYDNLGIPRNGDLPFYSMPRKWNSQGEDWIDPGLGGFLARIPEYADHAEANHGKHKVPTLRNVDMRPNPEFVKAYGHNGYFKSLEEIVHFYNTRDVDPMWPDPEVPENVNTDELGNLGLTLAEEAAIVAFMKSLTDGYVLAPPEKVAVNGIKGLALRAPGIVNASSLFSYHLPQAGHVQLDVFDLRGQRVTILARDWQAAGDYQVSFPANNLASGVYLLRLASGAESTTAKFSIIR
jgi:hypothetical protein